MNAKTAVKEIDMFLENIKLLLIGFIALTFSLPSFSEISAEYVFTAKVESISQDDLVVFKRKSDFQVFDETDSSISSIASDRIVRFHFNDPSVQEEPVISFRMRITDISNDLNISTENHFPKSSSDPYRTIITVAHPELIRAYLEDSQSSKKLKSDIKSQLVSGKLLIVLEGKDKEELDAASSKILDYLGKLKELKIPPRDFALGITEKDKEYRIRTGKDEVSNIIDYLRELNGAEIAFNKWGVPTGQTSIPIGPSVNSDQIKTTRLKLESQGLNPFLFDSPEEPENSTGAK